MSGFAITGWGAVSPAGWGVAALREVAEPVPAVGLERPGWDESLRVRRAPKDGMPRQLFRHARLRRTSTIGRFAMAAAHEAVEMADLPEDRRLGIVYTTTCGCVNYSRRFYAEVLDDPAVASPLIFPETVFNAPASHLSAVWENPAVNYTLVGDSGVFLQGLAVAANWLEAGRVDDCLVVAAEEADWITADVLRHFDRRMELAEGAGALLLSRGLPGVGLGGITSVHDYAVSGTRKAAWHSMVAELSGFDGTDSQAGPAISIAAPDERLGEGFAAGAAWQSVMAIDQICTQDAEVLAVGVPGVYQFAVGALFKKANNA